MYGSPPRSGKGEREWVVTGHKGFYYPERLPITPRANYSFQSRIRHLDIRKYRRSKNSSFDNTFPVNSAYKDAEFFRKFPARKMPMSVRSKRPTKEYIDILGTQLVFVPNKRINR